MADNAIQTSLQTHRGGHAGDTGNPGGEAERQRLSALPSGNKQHCVKNCTKESLAQTKWSLLEMDAGED